MKKLVKLCIYLSFSIIMYGQAPLAFNYQANISYCENEDFIKCAN